MATTAPSGAANTTSASRVVIRKATIEDVPEILALITDLAIYEKEPNAVKTTEEDLKRDGFPTDGTPPFYHALLASVPDHSIPSGLAVAGFALYFFQYSTWEGRVLYLEDIFVRPSLRRHGAGEALFQTLAREAHAHRCKRFQWQVLAWNEPSIGFFERRVGAREVPGWLIYRLNSQGIDEFIQRSQTVIQHDPSKPK